MVDLQPHLHPDVLALCLGLLAAYGLAVWRYGRILHPRPGDRPVSARQVASFLAGVGLIWVAAASPLHDLGEKALFSAHTVEHLLYALAIPPLLLIGTPPWMGQLLLRRLPGARVVRMLARPVPAALAFNGVLLAMHTPAAVDLMVTSEPAHLGLHALMLASAFLMWLPVLSPVPEIPTLSPPGQMFYLFLQTLLPTVPASFLTFAGQPVYGIYAELPKLWGITALEDVRAAGLILKIGGGFFLWIVIAVLFFRWAGAEDATARSTGTAPRTGRPTTRGS